MWSIMLGERDRAPWWSGEYLLMAVWRRGSV